MGFSQFLFVSSIFFPAKFRVMWCFFPFFFSFRLFCFLMLHPVVCCLLDEARTGTASAGAAGQGSR